MEYKVAILSIQVFSQPTLYIYIAMKPDEIREFFVPIVDRATVMNSAYNKFEEYKRLSPGLETPDYQQPVITVTCTAQGMK